ncbi:zinc finger, CCHC-type containing protein [Tanacetum coccineum]
MLQELKSMFEKQAGVERFDLIQTFHACKQEEGKPVAAYVLKMKGYLDQLEYFGYVLPQDLSVGLILNGLTSDFDGFVRNYNMHNMGKTIGELHAMLIEYEKGLPKKAETLQVMAIRSGKIQKTNKKSLKAKGKGKANGKEKDKQVNIPKPKNLKPTAKEHPAKDDTYHHCKEVGHWKRNCPVYLAELLKKKKQVGTASSSGLRGARKLEQGALYLYVGNGVRAQVEAIGSFDLVLPNGLRFMDYGILVSKNVVLYFNAIPRDGYYGIDMHNLVPNVNSIYNVSNKRAKHNLDSTYLWHYHLSHISKKRKMTRKPFSHRTERATDLLRIIHTDVCGLLRHVSRQGASYFITFTDDYSRYEPKGKRVILLFYFPSENKIGVARYVKSCEKSRIHQEVSGRAIDLEEIQDEDTSPSKITSKIPIEVEGFEPPQEEVILIRSLQSVKDYLGKCFAMKDLGEAAFILGIKIYRDRLERLIGLSQSAYMDKILKRYRMDNSKCGHIPIQERLDLNKTQGASTPEEVKRMQNAAYALAVGSIIGNPEAELRANCYCDAEFETDRDDIKSQTGYVFVLNGGAVDWKSSKQSTTEMSTTEAEYFAASEASMEAVWIRKFISGLGIIPTINEPIKMFCDNSAALLIANEPGVQKGARHYHRRYHYVRECIELGEINLLKVHTYDNLTDPFTKTLPKGKLTQHARSIGLRLASSFM